MSEQQKQKILIADDNKQTRELFKKFFVKAEKRNELTVEIAEAADGNEAIIMLDTEKPDLILCDIGMPEKDGFEVLDYFANIRNPADPHCVFVFLTASPDERKNAYEKKADGFLSKLDLSYYPFMLQIRVWLRIAYLTRERKNLA